MKDRLALLDFVWVKWQVPQTKGVVRVSFGNGDGAVQAVGELVG